MMRKIRKIALLSALLAIVFTGGCNLITGTFVIDFTVERNDITPHDDFEYFRVDLTENETWEEHKDKIKYIDNVGFQLWVTNNGSSVTWELYADTISTPYVDVDDIRDDAKQVLGGLTLAPGETYIDWPTSLIYLNSKELPTFKNWVETGQFDIYAVAGSGNYNIRIDSARIIVTVTAGE
jgi:hypothetical protein